MVQGLAVQVSLHQDYQNYLLYHNKFNERGNTIGEFVMYLVCSLLILAADIPLAVDMLKWLMYSGMGGNNSFSFTNLDDKNMNLLISAIGIALSSIFIKVWYDKFVGKKYGHAVILKKKFEELFDRRNWLEVSSRSQATGGANQAANSSLNASSCRDLSTDDIDTIARNERGIRRVEIVLLGLTLAAIFMLGIFRSYVRRHPIESEDDLPAAVTAPTFILITLMFSVVSGVCLSISLSALTNYRRLRRSKAEEQQLEKAYLASSGELSDMAGKVQEARQIAFDLSARDSWVATIAQLLQSYYDIGFQEGYADPGHYLQGLDFFDRILAWRELFTARRFNASIHSLNTSNENKQPTADIPA